MKRRTFFKLIAGAMVAPVAAKAARLQGVPFLAGDGIHNDGPALNALFRGEIVEFGASIDAQSCGWVTPNVLVMPQGKFMSHETLVISGVHDAILQFNGAQFMWHDVDVGLELVGNQGTCIYDGFFDGSGVRQAVIFMRSALIFSSTEAEMKDWVSKDPSRLAVYADGTVIGAAE